MPYKKKFEFLEINILKYLEGNLSLENKVQFEAILSQLKNRDSWQKLGSKIMQNVLHQNLEIKSTPAKLIQQILNLKNKNNLYNPIINKTNEDNSSSELISSIQKGRIVLNSLNRMFEIVHTSYNLKYRQEKVLLRDSKKYLDHIIIEESSFLIHIIPLQEESTFFMEIELLDNIQTNIRIPLIEQSNGRLVMSIQAKDKKIQFKNLKIKNYTLYLPNKKLDIMMKQ